MNIEKDTNGAILTNSVAYAYQPGHLIYFIFILTLHKSLLKRMEKHGLFIMEYYIKVWFRPCFPVFTTMRIFFASWKPS